ncbi:MAG: adenine-specific methyltransferase EcoRI family protein, partial [Spirochaetia bacterium]|nr:adenine-specific methyltransferase EcoRI family protein [Spirochaetia bacterium]
KLGYKGNYTRLGNSCWYTNIEHGKRHAILPLMTEERNIKFSKHKEIKNQWSKLNEKDFNYYHFNTVFLLFC